MNFLSNIAEQVKLGKDSIANENFEDESEEDTKELVSDLAKPCVTKAFDYTLLVVLLVLQFLRCSPPSTEDILTQLSDTDGNLNNVTESSDAIMQLYSCNLSGFQTSVIFSSNSWINGLVLTTIVIAFLYAILVSSVVWIHSSRKAKHLEVTPTVKRIFAFTDKLLIIDTLIEIPIAIFLAPIATMFLWAFFCISVVGLILFALLFANTVKGDSNAQSVFNTSAFLVVFSLYNFTGEVSKYLVTYTICLKKEEGQVKNPLEMAKEDSI